MNARTLAPTIAGGGRAPEAPSAPGSVDQAGSPQPTVAGATAAPEATQEQDEGVSGAVSPAPQVTGASRG